MNFNSGLLCRCLADHHYRLDKDQRVFVEEKRFPPPLTTGLLYFTCRLCEQALQHSPGFTYRALDAADEVSDLPESLHTKLRDFCSAAEMCLTAEAFFFPSS